MPRRLLASVVALVVIPIGVEWLISFIKSEPYHVGRAAGVLAAIALIVGLVWTANASSRPFNLVPKLVLVVLGVLVAGAGSVGLVRDHTPEASLAAALLGLTVAGVAGYVIYIDRTGADFRLAVPNATGSGAVQLIEGDRATAALTRFSAFSISDEEVAELCLAKISADDVHFIGYYVDGKCRFHMDVLDSPTLNRFFRGDDRDQRRLAYERTGRQLDWVMSKLNMYTRRLDGGILVRTVLDVKHGALYHYWIDRNVYLIGITMDQSKVLVADEKLRRLANAIGHLPRGGTYPSEPIQQVVTANE